MTRDTRTEAEIQTMRFVLPLPPNRANARGHWRVHYNAKVDYWDTLDTIVVLGPAARAYEAPKAPATPLARAVATATLYVWSPMDEGNALNRLKWLEDWLVERDYLTDDNARALRWSAIPEQVIDRKNPRVEITLEAA